MRYVACSLIAASCIAAGCGNLPHPYARRPIPHAVERRTLPPEGLSYPTDLPFRYTITPLVRESGVDARATAEAAYAREAGVAWIPAKGEGKPTRVIWGGGRLVIGGTGSVDPTVNNLGDRVGMELTGKTRPGGDIPMRIRHAWLWNGNTSTDLGSLTGPDGDSVATAINNRRQIAGTSGREAFIWEHGVMRSLGRVPGYGPPEPCAINERGTVVGTCTGSQDMGGAIWGDAFQVPFIWNHNRLRLLPVPPQGTKTSAIGLDDRDTAIGYDFHYGWQHAKREKTPLLWVKDKVYDLSELIGRNSQWNIVMPIAISRDGRILASAQTDMPSSDFRTSWTVGRAVLLTPSSQKEADSSAASLYEQTRRIIYSGGQWAPSGGNAALASPVYVPSPRTNVRYSLQVLNAPSHWGEARLNNHGQVVGLGGEAKSAYWFSWERGRTKRLAPITEFTSCSLTEDGTVIECGFAGVYAQTPKRRKRLLDTGASRAYINASGDMVTIDPSLLVVGGKVRPFDPTGHAEAHGINSIKVITGQRKGRAFIWRNGRFSSLGVLPNYFESAGLFINNGGQIVGTCTRPADLGGVKWVDAYVRPFIWERGDMRSLGAMPDCPRLFPTGLNNHGTIVGIGRGKRMHPIVWLKEHPYEIQGLVNNPRGWTVEYPDAIDDHGRILVSMRRQSSPRAKIERRFAFLNPFESPSQLSQSAEGN